MEFWISFDMSKSKAVGPNWNYPPHVVPDVPALIIRVLTAMAVAAVFPSLAGRAFADDDPPRYAVHLLFHADARAQSAAVTKGCDGCESAIHMVANDQAPMAYFLDELQSDEILAGLPTEATDIVVAKVRATQRPSSLGGPDQLEVPPTRIPRDRFFIRIPILEVLRGSATVGAEYAAYFGEPGRRIIFPLSEDQLGRDYLAVVYRSTSDAKYRLLGIPISLTQYTKWREEFARHLRSQRKK